MSFEATGQRQSTLFELSATPTSRSGHSKIHVLPENGADELFGFLFKAGSSDSALVIGDSKKILARMPAGVFQTCITSPPYWSLRNYNIPGQIGLERSLDDYIANLVAVFEEARRVLRDDGTMW